MIGHLSRRLTSAEISFFNTVYKMLFSSLYGMLLSVYDDSLHISLQVLYFVSMSFSQAIYIVIILSRTEYFSLAPHPWHPLKYIKYMYQVFYQYQNGIDLIS